MKYRASAMILAAWAGFTAAAPPTVQLSVQKSGSGGVMVLVVAKDMPDLDTYSFEIRYDTAALKATDASLDAPLMNITNMLRGKGRALLPVIKKEAGKVTIAATLSGNKSDDIPSRSGTLGVALFKILGTTSGKISIQNARFLDSKGAAIEQVTVIR